MAIQQLQTSVKTPLRAQRRGKKRLMYLPSSRDRVDAIVPPQHPRHLLPFRIGKADTLLLLLLRLGAESALELLCFPGAEIVTAPDDVGSVCVMGGIEGGDEGEHLGRVPAAAEDDEKVRRCAAFAGGWTAAVDGGEDGDKTEECRG